MGLAVPAPHVCLLLRVTIWDDNNHRTIGKDVLSGFYFLHTNGTCNTRKLLLTISFNAILTFLRREGEKGVLAEGKASSWVPVASYDPRNNYDKVWPPSYRLCPWKFSFSDPEKRNKFRAPRTFL